MGSPADRLQHGVKVVSIHEAVLGTPPGRGQEERVGAQLWGEPQEVAGHKLQGKETKSALVTIASGCPIHSATWRIGKTSLHLQGIGN